MRKLKTTWKFQACCAQGEDVPIKLSNAKLVVWVGARLCFIFAQSHKNKLTRRFVRSGQDGNCKRKYSSARTDLEN